MSAGRSLPHSTEAEECLISTCLLDGAEIIPKCIEAKIEPESFYDSKHGIIYGCLRDLYNRGVPVDISIVAEELKTAKLLERAGGFQTLMQVSEKQPTTAQAGYFIDKVREHASLRNVIRSATAVVEDCYNFSGEIDGLLSRTRERIDTATDLHGVANELTLCQYNPAKKLAPPEPIFTMAKTIVLTPGNIGTVTAQSKAGKSAFMGGFISAAMSDPEQNNDNFKIEGKNRNHFALLHFDTELSPYDWQKWIEGCLTRSKKKELPPWFLSYSFTGKNPLECRRLIEKALKEAHKKFGGIFCVIIDGTADLVIDPNDSAECFPFVTELHGLAIKYNTGIINILHMNPGSDAKGRGHLGSQLERKSESNLTMEKDDDGITKVWGLRQRGKMIMKKDAISFKWSESAGMHVSTDAAETGHKQPHHKVNGVEFGPYASIFPRTAAEAKPAQQLLKLAIAKKPATKSAMFFRSLEEWTEQGILATDPKSPDYAKYFLNVPEPKGK